MSYDGVFLDAQTVRFDRLLPGPIELVWDHLTKSDLLATWLASATGDMRKGGSITLAFTFSAQDQCGDSIAQGVVEEYEPPRLLAFTWRELDETGKEKPASVVRFELSPQGDQVHLVLTHRRLSQSEMAGFGAGWDSHLLYLAARIAGKPVKPFAAIFEAALQHYGPLAKSVTGVTQNV